MPPIHQKRIVAFVNTFLMKTAEFLDQFATICEERFIEVEGKLNRMEAVLSLLETKVSLFIKFGIMNFNKIFISKISVRFGP